MNAPRIPPVRHAEASPEQRRIGDTIFGSRDEAYGGPSAVLLHVPAIAERFEALRNTLVRDQILTEAMVNLIALMAARHWSSSYAWWKRVPLCISVGISTDAIEAVRAQRRPELDDPALRAGYDYAAELLSRGRVSDDVHSRLLGLVGQRGVIEAASIASFYSMLCLLCNAFEVALPDGVLDPLKEEGTTSP